MKPILYTLLILLVFSCSSSSDSTTESNKEAYRIIKISKPSDTFEPKLKIDALLSFYPNNKYTVITTNGEYLENVVKSSSDDKIEMIIDSTVYNFTKKEDKDTGWLTLEASSPVHPLEITLTKTDKLHYKKLDLLSPGRNWWRVKPTKKETEREIHTRLAAHLNYLIDYFQMVDDMESRTFSTEYLNLPLKLYGNGIAISRDYYKTPFEWRDSFYDDEDAYYAFNTLKKALNSIEKYPKDPKNHLVGFRKALKMMVSYIES